MHTRRVLLLGAAAIFGTYAASPAILRRVGEDIGLCTPPNQGNVDDGVYANTPYQDANTAFSPLYSATDKQFTLVGESDHTDARIPNFFYSKANIQNMVTSGVKHVCIEWNAAEQSALDDVQNGTVTPEEFADTWRTNWGTRDFQREQMFTLAKGVKELSARGIKVHAIDVYGEHTSNTTATEQFHTSSSIFHQEMCGADSPLTTRSQVAYAFMHPISFIRSLSDANEVQSERANDRERVNLIRQKCGDEKAVIFMGSRHFSGTARSIRNHLVDECNHAELFGSLTSYTQRPYTDPDFFFFAEEGKAIQPDNMRHAVLQTQHNAPVPT